MLELTEAAAFHRAFKLERQSPRRSARNVSGFKVQGSRFMVRALNLEP
jgi:hypothetical protein